MGKRTGTVVAIDNGLAIVRVRGSARLVHIPQQVLPVTAPGATVSVDVADWELDGRATLVCLPAFIALAGGLLFGAVGAILGTALGAVAGWLVVRATHQESARLAPRRSQRSAAATK